MSESPDVPVDPEPRGKWVNVSEVLVGDFIEWCGQTVHVVDWKPQRRYPQTRRTGRYLICTLRGGAVHQLHYFDDEWVRLVLPAFTMADVHG